MKKIILLFVILTFLSMISAANYGNSNYGCGLFGVGCSEEVTSTTTSGGGGGGRTAIQFDVKILEIDSDLTLGDYFDFTYFVKGVGTINYDVTIDFWIEDLNGQKISSGSDVIYFGVNEEKTETASLLIPEGIESGIYQLKVKATYNAVTGESHRTIQLDIEEGKIRQLFDISFFLEETTIQNSDEIIAVISFENFGTVATEINLIYSILDDEERKVYLEGDSIIVETERVLRKSFVGLNLPKGKYTFVLETLYGNEVYDKFEQEFEIEKLLIWQPFFGAVLLTILIISIIFIRKHKNKRFESKKGKSVSGYKKKVKGRLYKLKGDEK